MFSYLTCRGSRNLQEDNHGGGDQGVRGGGKAILHANPTALPARVLGPPAVGCQASAKGWSPWPHPGPTYDWLHV